MFWYCFSHHALPWLAGSYPLDWMDDLESGIFGFLMKNWIDSAKKNQSTVQAPNSGFLGNQENVRIFLLENDLTPLSIWPLNANFGEALIFLAESIQFFMRNPKIPLSIKSIQSKG